MAFLDLILPNREDIRVEVIVQRTLEKRGHVILKFLIPEAAKANFSHSCMLRFKKAGFTKL